MQVCWHTCGSTNSPHSCPTALPAAAILGFLGADAVNCVKLFEMMWKLCVADVSYAVGFPYDLSEVKTMIFRWMEVVCSVIMSCQVILESSITCI